MTEAATAPRARTRSRVVDRLVQYVVATKRLTPRQVVSPWQWVQVDGEIVGVRIPPDGDVDGLRVSVKSMELWQ